MAEKTKRQLFEPGKITITAEAFLRLKELQVDPRQLVGRHTRGDWDGAPVDWMIKNEARLKGDPKYPVMSVYQLHPSELRVAVGTSPDFSETSISNWPDGKRMTPEYPLDSMEAGHQVTKRSMEKASFARSLMDGTAAKKPKPKQKPRGRGMDISR